LCIFVGMNRNAEQWSVRASVYFFWHFYVVASGTMTRVGFCFCNSLSRRVIVFAVCCAWVPLPTFRFATGSGRRGSWKKIFVIS